MNLDLLKEYVNSPSYDAKLTERLLLQQECIQNYFKRQETLLRCIDDPVFFIENFLWVNEPRFSLQPDLEFFLFDHQKEAISEMLKAESLGEDRLFDKSRDMGFTWIASAYYMWRWLFTKGWIGLFGSRKQEEVDNRCYSDDTEVLTRDGWKLFKDVDIEKDEFATRNRDKEFEWQKSFYKHEADYDGDFYNIKSRTMDLMVSPNHRVLYKNESGNNELIQRADELSKHKDPCIPATSIWEGKELDEFKIDYKKSKLRKYKKSEYITKEFGGIKMSGDDYCAFMGMFLSEGCTVVNSGNTVMITQLEKSKGYEDFRKLLIRIFGKEPYYNGFSWQIGKKSLFNYLLQFGKAKDKFIPQEILNSSKRQLEIFFHFYMLGDGSWKSSSPTITTVSRKMADQLQEVIQKIGFSSTVSTTYPKVDKYIGDRIIKIENQLPCYTLRVRTSPYQKVNITKTYYKGKIYCVSVPNEILYVRRNGYPAWCGNTISSFFGKLEYNLDKLPRWVMPQGFKKRVHKGENKLMNPVNGSLIQGESSNPRFGQGRRSSILIADELFLQEYAEVMWRNTAETCRCRIAITTPQPTRFAKSLVEGMEANGWRRKFHWRQHPFKDEIWYEHEKKRYGSDELGMKTQLELEYTIDTNLLVYPQADLIKIIDVQYDKGLPLYISMDWGVAPSQTVFLWFQFINGMWTLVEGMSANEKPFHWYMPFLCPEIDIPSEMLYNKVERDTLDKVRQWRKGSIFYGEAAHFARQVTTSTSVAQELAKFGIMLRYNSMAINHEPRQAAVKDLIRKGAAVANTHYAKQCLDALLSARFPASKGVSANRVAPIHDETADYRAAFENFAAGMNMNTKVKEITYRSRTFTHGKSIYSR